MTQTTVIDSSLAELTQEFEAKRGALLRMKQEQESAARELAQLDATKAAKAQATAQAQAAAEREHNEVVAPSQQAFDAITERSKGWLVRMAETEAQLHALGKEQHALLREYEAAANEAGTLARNLSPAAIYTLFDANLWQRVQLIPENWPREVGNYFAVWVNVRQVHTTLRNAYRRGVTGN